MNNRVLHIVGCASGIAGADEHSGDGPVVVQASPMLKEIGVPGQAYDWDAMVRPTVDSNLSIEDAVAAVNHDLAHEVSNQVMKGNHFCVVGGDHTSAIGTWSGVYDAMHHKGDLGLIWIDAHMDAHTPETTESGRIHGMPLAALLGLGYPALTQVLHEGPKLKPENVCLVGVRSFENGEAETLKRLNVRVFYMDEINARGFESVMRDAVMHVTQHTTNYGISFDLDALDPVDAPGVDVPEPNGIKVKDMLPVMHKIFMDPRLIATEIVEFDPTRDHDHKTEKIVIELLKMMVV